jgi:trehalose 6-phosphate phosphatase
MNQEIKAAIFDLDGVITETATLHARAWKQMFDAYNKRRKEDGKNTYTEFSIEEDYPVYLDGKPRYKGVKSFLESRQLDLPYGDPDDEPGKETICGLGNLKNDYFHKILDEEGVHIIEKNVFKLKEWRNKGLKTAIISSSKNCKQILKAAGIEHLFDVRVDGVISKERNLKGKPDPDIFVEAARELNVKPEESIIIEDALSGVEAGRRGNFKIVIGISGDNYKEQMLKRGADVVVRDLGEYDLFNNEKATKNSRLPWVMDHLELFVKNSTEYNTLLCIDYDGTLTPIVEDFTKAFLKEEMRSTLKEVAKILPVAIVSGRDTKFIKKQVNLNELFYAGSHGFEIEGPGDFYYEVEESQEILPVLDKAEERLYERFKNHPSVEIERKKYAIAIHYRKVNEEDIPHVKDIVDQVLSENPELKKGTGKRIVELKPNIDWDKGKAVEVLSRQVPAQDEPVRIIYIGDDVTDEDAFRVIDNGYGILVGHPEEDTFADYYLKDVDEVQLFLQKLTEHANVK